MNTSKRITSRQIVKKIKQELKRKKIYESGMVEYREGVPIDNLKEIRRAIEFSLITIHEYISPEEFYPKNPLLRLVKKVYLFVLNPLIKYQNIYNSRILVVIENLYKYLRKIEQNEKNRNRRTKIR